MLLSEALDAFVSVKKQEGYSQYTLSSRKIHINGLIKEIGNIDIEKVKLPMLRDYVAGLDGLKSSSVGQKIRAIRVLFAWLVDEEYLGKSPAVKLKEPKKGKFVPKAFTVDEIELIRDSCETLLEHALIEFFFATGCRLSEVQQLNKNAIDFDRKAVTVFGKGSKEREVYFGAKAAIWIRRYIESRTDDDPALFVTQNAAHRISKHHIEYLVKKVGDRCGIQVTPHKFRHSLATYLINQGAPILTVKEILGHDKVETTLRYTQLSGEARHQAYNRYFVQ